MNQFKKIKHKKLEGLDTRNLWWKHLPESSTLLVSDVEHGKSISDGLRKVEIKVSNILQAPARSAVVVSPLVQMRALPSHQSELLSQAILGETVLVYEIHDSWLHIQSMDGYVGWIWSEGIQFIDFQPNSIVIGPLEYFYKDNSFQEPMFPLFAGARIFCDESGFCELPKGETGFVKRGSIRKLLKEPQSIDIAQLVHDAFRFLGLPYLWGGSKGTTLDCSGFMQLIFGFQGFMLPRDASQQALLHEESHPFQYLIPGKLGNKTEDFLTKGALLFFSTQNRVTHVGLALGDGKFIHASDSVKINSLVASDVDYAPDRKETFSFAIVLA